MFRSTPALSTYRLVSLAVGLALAFAAPPPTAAEEAGWIPLGPAEGQEVRSLAALPGTPGGVSAAGVSGVFRTDDGTRWTLLNGALPDPELPPGLTGTLSSTPVPGGAVFLASGPGRRIPFVLEDVPPPPLGPGAIYTSDDDGETWRFLREDSGLLALSSREPSTLYLASPYEIEASRDSGETWFSVTPDGLDALRGTAEIIDLAMAPSDPDTVYIFTVVHGGKGYPDEIHIFRSRDGAGTWQELQGPELERIPGSGGVGGSDLAVDPEDPDVVYVALSRGLFRGVFPAGDGEATWESRTDGLPSFRTNSGRETVYPITKIVADPRSPETLFAATRQVDDAPGGVYRSSDAGTTWVASSDGLPLPLTVTDLVIDPVRSGTLHAATGDGVFRSTDHGASWTRIAAPLPTPTASVVADPLFPATLFTGTIDGRVFTSDDGGQQWTRTARQFERAGAVRLLSIAPADRSLLFMNASGMHTLGRSTDGGATWETVEGPPFGDITAVLGDPRDPSRVLASVGQVGGVFASTDRGTTWSWLFEGRTEVLAQAPSNPDVLYGGTRIGAQGGVPSGVCRSIDGGGSWQCSDTGLEEGREVTALAVDPRDASHVLGALRVGGINQEPAEPLLVRSVDGGATWERVLPGLPTADVGGVDELMIDHRNPDIVWAGTQRGGVFRSRDGGASWEAVNRGLTHLDIRDLHQTPDGRTLVAATGSGTFRFSASAGPAPPPEIDWIEDPALSGFRVKARIAQGGGAAIPATQEPVCIPETVCLSGALPGRSELFVRVVGPKPNGYLWPTLVKFSTSRIEIWIQQRSTGEIRYYELEGASPGVDRLPGLFDRRGFLPD